MGILVGLEGWLCRCIWTAVRVRARGSVRVRVGVSVQLADFTHTRLFAAIFIITISIDVFMYQP